VSRETTDPFALAVLAVFERPEVMQAIVEKLLPHLGSLVEQPPDAWLDTNAAADYLGITPNAVHKASAARNIPCHQRIRGGKLWFRRSELDDWRRDGDRGRFHAASTRSKTRR
jgi:hypothetical protein